MPPDSAITRRGGAVGEPERLEQRVGLDPRLATAHPEEAAVEHEVLADGQGAIERVALGHDADQALGRGGLAPHVDPADHGAALGRLHPGREHARGRGLAGAVRAQETEDLAAADAEVEVVDRAHAARVDLGEVLGEDHLVGGGWAHGAIVLHVCPSFRTLSEFSMQRNISRYTVDSNSSVP